MNKKQKKETTKTYSSFENTNSNMLQSWPYLVRKKQIDIHIKALKQRVKFGFISGVDKSHDDKKVILEVDDLSVNYNSSKGIVRAVKDISFKVREGTITSIVGETGSGKSSTAFAIVGTLPHATGNVKINNYIIPASSRFITKKFRKYLAKTLQFIFQDPFTSMNPKSRVSNVLGEPLKVNNPYKDLRDVEKANMFHEINLYLVRLAEKITSSTLDDLRTLAKKIYFDRETIIKDLKERMEVDKYRIKNAKAQVWQIKNSYKTRLKTFIEKKQFLQRQHIDDEKKLRDLISKHNDEFVEFKTNLKKRRDLELRELKKDVVKQKAKRVEDKKQLTSLLRILNKETKKFDYEILKIYKNYKGKHKLDPKTFEIYYKDYIYKDMENMPSSKRFLIKLVDSLTLGLMDLFEYKWIIKRINKIKNIDQLIANRLAKIVNSYFAKYSRVAAKHAITKIIQDRLIQVGLSPQDMLSYPKDFSGGQKQRIAIARAMMTNPQLLIADEPISSLDVSIQAQIVNLIKDLKDKNNLTVLFIAHDLRMVEFISDRIVVMSKGQIVEAGSTKEIFENPTHPYTRSLFSAIPSIDTMNKELDVLDYDPNVYQNPNLDLKEIPLSSTHSVLSTEEWIDEWWIKAQEFVVYEHSKKLTK